MKRLSRLLYLIHYLSARYGVPAVDLAHVCGVSERTISRDINDIHQAGFPVLYHHGYHIMRSGATPADTFTVAELQSLVAVICREDECTISFCDDRLRKIVKLVKRSGLVKTDFQTFSSRLCFWYGRMHN
jgi:predicted DNA-binding transcriptional regulator YafY